MILKCSEQECPKRPEDRHELKMKMFWLLGQFFGSSVRVCDILVFVNFLDREVFRWTCFVNDNVIFIATK